MDMGNALLEVAINEAGSTYVLDPIGLRIQGPRRSELERMASESSSYSVSLSALTETFRRLAVPPGLDAAIRDWAADAGVGATLGVRSAGNNVTIPWELLPRALGLPELFVARIVQMSPSVAACPEIGEPPGLLAAAWSTSRTGGFMPGVGLEIGELSRMGGGRIEVETLLDRPFEELRVAYEARTPSLVHLVANANGDDPPQFILLLHGARRVIDADTLSSALASPRAPRLVVLNTCFAGTTMARHLCERLGCITIGWANSISDRRAPEFASHLYGRLLEGASVVQAVRSFMRRFDLQLGDDEPISNVWLPSLEAADVPVLAPAAIPPPARRSLDGALYEIASPGAQHQPFAGPVRSVALPGGDSAEAAEVRLDFRALAAICPALLKNGRPLFKNPSIKAKQRRRVRLEIICDTGSATSTYRRMIDLEPPNKPVPCNDMHFPALYDLIEGQANRRYVSFSVSVSDRDEVLDEMMCASLWLGVDEWIDQRELWPFLPAFVRPSCGGVDEILDRANDVLKDIGDPGDAFDGYNRKMPNAASKQIQAIYQTLRKKFSLNYVSPQAGRVLVPGAGDLAVQFVRSPAGIVKHRRGTCHDLSLLLASCAEHVVIRPLVVLARGHTFFGFWVGDREHARYWESRRGSGDRPEEVDFGKGWMIKSPDELRKLVNEQQIIVVEATAVTRPGDDGDYRRACEDAAKRVQEMTTADLDAAVDVTAARHAVQPL
jgi:hypothetical protein